MRLSTIICSILFMSILSDASSFAQTNETWVLAEVRKKGSRNPISIPPEEFIELSFHGKNCITINSKCTSMSGIYARDLGPFEIYIIRAMPIVENKCSNDFFGNDMEKFRNTVVIDVRDKNSLKILSHHHYLTFLKGKPTAPLNCIDPCSLEPNGGVCRALFRKYYFDQEEQRCMPFNWGGCAGVVPFESLEDCQDHCGNR